MSTPMTGSKRLRDEPNAGHTRGNAYRLSSRILNEGQRVNLCYRMLVRIRLAAHSIHFAAEQSHAKLKGSTLGGRTLVLTIRLARIGKKKKPYYRVVVIERTRARDGRVREAVGTYDPLKKPAEIKLDSERIKYWLGVGAQPSDTVRSFIKQQKIA
jgi:ribosomal protein S16